jgi:hypothetical protein
VQVLIDIRRLAGIVAVNYRSPAKAVDFLILDDLAPAPGLPASARCFQSRVATPAGERGRCGPLWDNAEVKEKLPRSPG